MCNRQGGFLIAATMLVSQLAGCGNSVHVVEGQVSLNGQPLEHGEIDFEPAENGLAPFGGEIRGGRYRIETSSRQATGKATVRIRSPQPTGRKVSAGPPAPPGQMVDEIAEVVPPQYNTKSTLLVELSDTRLHTFDFDLKR